MIFVSTTKKEIISVFFGVFTTFIQIIFQFILMYLLIHNYGAQFNGFIKISIALLSFLGGIEGGLGTLTVIYLVKPLLQKDWSRANEIINTAKNKYKIGGIFDLMLLFLISIGYSFYIYFAEENFSIIWNGGSVSFYHFGKVLAILLFIGSKNLFSSFGSSYYENLMQADQNNYVRRLILVICDLVIYSFIFYLIALNIDPIYVFSSFLGYSVLKSILIILFVKKHYSWIVITKQKNDLQLFKNSKIVSLKNIGDSLLLNTGAIVISILLGLKVSSTLSLYMTISVGVRAVMMILINSFKEFFASGTAKNGRISGNSYVKYETYSYMIGSFLFINQFILSPYLVNALYAPQIITEFNLSTSTGTEIEKQIFDVIFYFPSFSLLIAISSVFLIIAEPCNVLVYAKANYKQTAKPFFLFGVLNLILSFVFAIYFFYICKSYLATLYSVLIVSCFIFFVRFIYLGGFTWLNLTYNSSFKGIFQNGMILLIPITCAILSNYFYIFKEGSPKNIFDSNLNVIIGWKKLLLFFFSVIGLSILFIFVNLLFGAPKSVGIIFLFLPIVYKLLKIYYKRKKMHEGFYEFFGDDLVTFRKPKNPYQQQGRREEFINKSVVKVNRDAVTGNNFVEVEDIYKIKG